MLFGQYLKKLRSDAGISQKKLADAVEMDTAYLSRIENGVNEYYPQEAAIRKFITALRIGRDTAKCDTLYRLAGRIPPDIKQIIMRQAEMFEFIRGQKKGNTNGRRTR